ncbi:hypothetical protein GCM10023331_06820 [Algivirga pacifica]|uniref:Uncharacterized protein n=1 Tax=Algivirga pacifica TaxID=1162670 RepID=A0ABP9D2N8_9BACT
MLVSPNNILKYYIKWNIDHVYVDINIMKLLLIIIVKDILPWKIVKRITENGSRGNKGIQGM